MGVTQQLVQQIIKAKYEDIPRAAAERIRAAILDDVGIAFLGYDAGGKPLVEYAKDVGRGVTEATLIGDGAKVSCMVAAGVNAQMAWDSNMYETGPGHHELSSMAQTAIAVGDRVDASGRDVINAVALAYQINGQFHRAAVPPEHSRALSSKRHIILSTAIVAGKLLGLNEAQFNHALGIAWLYTPHSREFQFRHLTWFKRTGSFHLGTCHLGIQAAILAQKGFEGPLDFVEKESFYDLGRLMSSPAPYYYPAKELFMKPWVAPQSLQPGIQAALEIQKEHGIKPEEIEGVRFLGEKMLTEFPFSNPAPKEYWDAIYSGEWSIAMALMGYEPGREWTREERLKDPACRAMARKVKLETHPQDTATWIIGKIVSDDYTVEVEITARGKRYRKELAYPQQIGSPHTPMSQEQLWRKFKTNAGLVIGERQSEELFGMLTRLHEQKRVRDVTKLFKAQ